ncbi:MAG: 50S ribosomal protein L22 [Candidatus Micrarchaeota archaeon]|nr:50S ribosomal protein L22 [Candidatus Micrarchaeota archaeon]
MNYSFNIKGDNFVKAGSYDVNASYKKLGAICDAIRYQKAEAALVILDKVISMEMPVAFRRHNKHMGARHELGGIKGAYPVKAAKEVKKTLVNAIANANNKGLSGNDMFIVGVSANKTHIERRYPSKGSIAWGRGMYGRSAINHSDIEFARIEIVLSDQDTKQLTHNMKYFIKRNSKNAKKLQPKKTEAKKPTSKPEAKKLEPQKTAPAVVAPAQAKA